MSSVSWTNILSILKGFFLGYLCLLLWIFFNDNLFPLKLEDRGTFFSYELFLFLIPMVVMYWKVKYLNFPTTIEILIASLLNFGLMLLMAAVPLFIVWWSGTTLRGWSYSNFWLGFNFLFVPVATFVIGYTSLVVRTANPLSSKKGNIPLLLDTFQTANLYIVVMNPWKYSEESSTDAESLLRDRSVSDIDRSKGLSNAVLWNLSSMLNSIIPTRDVISHVQNSSMLEGWKLFTISEIRNFAYQKSSSLIKWTFIFFITGFIFLGLRLITIFATSQRFFQWINTPYHAEIWTVLMYFFTVVGASAIVYAVVLLRKRYYLTLGLELIPHVPVEEVVTKRNELASTT